MNSDSNPYDPNAPIRNPYETTAYGSPPPSNPNQNNPSYPPAPDQNYSPYPYAPENPPSGGNPYPPGQYQQYPPPPPPAPGGQPYQYPNAVPPLPTYNAGGPSPRPRSSTGLRIGVIVLVVLVIIVGAIAIAIPVHNTQVANDNATVTAQALSRTATAQASNQATATAQAFAQATATAAANTYPFSANIKLNDPLTDNSRGYGWQTTSNCSFTGGAYHNLDTTANTFLPCVALQTNFSNFTYQASMQILKGTIGGITFRGNDVKSQFYAFVLGTDGSYAFFLYTHNGKPQTLKDGSVPQFNTNQANLVGVVARGNSLGLYVNKQEVTTLTDSTYSSGQVGTISYDVGQVGEAAYTNAEVWAL